MCTARISSGMSVRAYWIARAVLWSSRATKTSTTWRRRIGAVDRVVGVVLELVLLGLVLPVQADEQRDHHRDDHDDDPGAPP